MNNPNENYAVYYCSAKSQPDRRRWDFFTKVEGFDRAIAACKVLRDSGRAAQAVRLDPEAIELPARGDD